MGWRCQAFWSAAVILLIGCVLMASTAKACSAKPETGAIARVSPYGELILQDGRILRLAWLSLADGSLRDTALQMLHSLKDQPLAFDVLGQEDRWGRLPVRVNSLHVKLVEQGLALVHPEQVGRACFRDLAAREKAALQTRLGLWGEDSLLDASHEATLLARQGTYAVIEGVILGVGERQFRTYLNFGRDWSKDLTISVPKKIWSSFKTSGIDVKRLTNSRVRVRGLIEEHGGPFVEIAFAEELELLP